MEHHTVIIVGGGPAGLPLAVILGGWHPHYCESPRFTAEHPELARRLRGHRGTLLGLDFAALARGGVLPADLFRRLHHSDQGDYSPHDNGLEFRRGEPLDALLLTREDVGGMWNRAPHNLLTLTPGYAMEFAFYPLARFAAETGRALAPQALILRRDLLAYYQAVPGRFGVADRLRTGEQVEHIAPHPRGFLLTARNLRSGTVRRYTCRYLVYAVGPRCRLRRLDVPGEELPFVTHGYNRPEELPGETIVVVGGGHSSDWAAIELFHAGKRVYYVMRQEAERFWRRLDDSRYRFQIPYCLRLGALLERGNHRLEALYQTRVTRFDAAGGRRTVTVARNGDARVLAADHAVIEIGSDPDYSLFQGFPPLQLVEKHDRFRFQCHQARTHPHNCESRDIPNLYLGGYLAEGLGLLVIAMHGAAYAIAGDILQREGALPTTPPPPP
jgi:thioredoxin reductase (NADPH)